MSAEQYGYDDWMRSEAGQEERLAQFSRCIAARLRPVLSDSLSETESRLNGSYPIPRNGHISNDRSYVRQYDCQGCERTVYASGPDVDAPDCPISGSCEISMIDMHPEQYLDEEGSLVSDSLPCANCYSELQLEQHDDGSISASVAEGRCLVEINNAKFRRTGRFMLNNMPLDDTTKKEERFDGESGATLGSRRTAAPNTNDTTCSGSVLNGYINDGMLPPPGTYVCPRSVRSGEHCLQSLQVDETGNITVQAGDIREDWIGHCLIRRVAPVDQ